MSRAEIEGPGEDDGTPVGEFATPRDAARASRTRLLDVYDMMFICGTGQPVTFQDWRTRWAKETNEPAAHRRWERLKQWVRAAELPGVTFPNLDPDWGVDSTRIAIKFTRAAQDLVNRLLDELAAASSAAALGGVSAGAA